MVNRRDLASAYVLRFTTSRVPDLGWRISSEVGGLGSQGQRSEVGEFRGPRSEGQSFGVGRSDEEERRMSFTRSR
jgi:hypothetical protein